MMEEDTVGWRPDPLVGASMFFRGLQSPRRASALGGGGGLEPPLPFWGSLPGPPPPLCLTPPLGVSSPGLSCSLHCPPR